MKRGDVVKDICDRVHIFFDFRRTVTLHIQSTSTRNHACATFQQARREMNQNSHLLEQLLFGASPTALLEKKQRQLERRRATCKRNQRLYRARKKAKEQRIIQRSAQLQHRIAQMHLYMGMLEERTILSPARKVSCRALILDLYGTYFEYGMDARDPLQIKKQRSFIEFNVMPDMVLSDPSQPRGPDALLQQWQMSTSVHRRFRADVTSIVKIHHGDVYRMTQKFEVVISHLTATILYPHMIHNEAFMEKAMGRTLVFTFIQTIRFSAQNKIESIDVDVDMLSAWAKLLEDPILALQVVGNINSKEARIQAECDEVQRLHTKQQMNIDNLVQ